VYASYFSTSRKDILGLPLRKVNAVANHSRPVHCETDTLARIFDEMRDLKNDMKKITAKNRELRTLVRTWETQWRDEKREIHLKLEELENKIKRLDIDTRNISDRRNVKIQDLIRLNNELKKVCVKE